MWAQVNQVLSAEIYAEEIELQGYGSSLIVV